MVPASKNEYLEKDSCLVFRKQCCWTKKAKPQESGHYSYPWRKTYMSWRLVFEKRDRDRKKANPLHPIFILEKKTYKSWRLVFEKQWFWKGYRQREKLKQQKSTVLNPKDVSFTDACQKSRQIRKGENENHENLEMIISLASRRQTKDETWGTLVSRKKYSPSWWWTSVLWFGICTNHTLYFLQEM